MGGLMPTMKSGDIVGHEFMGEVIDTGSAHSKFRKGDRIVVPVNINATNAPVQARRLLGVPAIQSRCGNGV
jgi:threonine dehydrogenase-like Zn-dependent dehydrogenase